MTNAEYNKYMSRRGNIMMTTQNVGEKLIKARKANSITQKQLADYLSVDQSYVSKLEKNERQFTIDIIEKLSALFGCTIEYFLSPSLDYEPIPFELRADEILGEDLETIAIINKIAMNLKFLEKVIK